MFTAFIALALELVSLVVGAMLLLACCRHCSKGYCSKTIIRTDDSKEKGTVASTNYPMEHHKIEHKNCNGFFKVVGSFTIVVSIITLIFTCIALGCFLVDAKHLERDGNAPIEQYNHDLNKLRKFSSSYEFLPRATNNTMVVPAPNRDN